MSEDTASWWARVISPGAGTKSGLYMVPDVGDEVMVVFEQGDFNRPYVLGGVWNNQDKLPGSGDAAGNNERHKIRTWTSATGHEISVYDNADNKIHIKTAAGHSLTLDDKEQKIEVISKGKSKLVIDDRAKKIDLESEGMLNIKSKQPMSIESNMTLKAQAKQVDMDGGPMVNIKGGIVKIN